MTFTQGRQQFLSVAKMFKNMRRLNFNNRFIFDKRHVGAVAKKIDMGSILDVKYLPTVLGSIAADMNF